MSTRFPFTDVRPVMADLGIDDVASAVSPNVKRIWSVESSPGV
jgi:hypothetical protein